MGRGSRQAVAHLRADAERRCGMAAAATLHMQNTALHKAVLRSTASSNPKTVRHNHPTCEAPCTAPSEMLWAALAASVASPAAPLRAAPAAPVAVCTPCTAWPQSNWYSLSAA